MFNWTIVGTIKCDFQQDWCGFSTSHTGDGPSAQGLDWKRQTGDTIKNKNLEGPDRGRFAYICFEIDIKCKKNDLFP